MSTSPPPPQQPEQQPQPSARPYPPPQQPAPAPGGQSPPAPPTLADRPVPPQQGNPYAQPVQPQPAGPYSPPVPPQPVGPYAVPGPYGPAAAPPPAGGGAGRAVLWAVVGAVAASAAWAAGVFLLDGKGATADLRGYTTTSNLCTKADYSSFTDEYPDKDSSPTHSALEDPALDESYCSVSLKKTGSSYADAYLSVQVDLHRKTDPGPEFTATWKKYDRSHPDYDVEAVRGIGDEAYLVTQDTSSGSSTSGSRYATLAVRDGWMTYTMSYSAYLSTYDEDKDPPELDEVTGWLKTDTKATLEALKS